MNYTSVQNSKILRNLRNCVYMDSMLLSYFILPRIDETAIFLMWSPKTMIAHIFDIHIIFNTILVLIKNLKKLTLHIMKAYKCE